MPTHTRELHFRDARAPHEIQAELERHLMTPLQPAMENSRLTFRASTPIGGRPHVFMLIFEAAVGSTNYCFLRVEASAANETAQERDAVSNALNSWFGLWTRTFTPANPPPADEGLGGRYQELCEAAFTAERQLTNVPALQQAIVTAMRRGASFSTSHKEGGTDITWSGGRFVRVDYGDSPARQEFPDDVAFLAFLRKFYDWETSRNIHPARVPELIAWRLILRLCRHDKDRRGVSVVSTATRKSAIMLTFAGVVVVAVIAVIGFWKFGMVHSTGSSFGSSMRVAGTIATLTRTRQPYLPSLSFRPRDANKDRYQIDLLLTPVDGESKQRLIPVARELPFSAFHDFTKILGVDGSVIWVHALGPYGVDVQTGRVITERELRRANPELDEFFWTAARFEFAGGRLHVTSRDDVRSFEIDSTTLKVKQVAAPPARTIASFMPQRPAPEDFLCAGGEFKPLGWLGVHSESEAQTAFKPGAMLMKEYSNERKRVPRRIYRVHIDSSGPVQRIGSMEPLSSPDFPGGSMIRIGRDAMPLRLSDPDGFLMVYYSGVLLKATMVVVRVDVDGKVRWTADTGIGDLEQVLPDARTFVFIGKEPMLENKISESRLAIVDITTGAVTKRSLRP